MNTLQKQMIQQAKQIHGEQITPTQENWENSFSSPVEFGCWVLWFDRECGTTAIFKESELI